ncbi:MAG: alpha/beta hydrolase, partial [Bacteroidales bacterium]|nr:alpha/beta hydrolase [Bacteroidales bacterium]
LLSLISIYNSEAQNFDYMKSEDFEYHKNESYGEFERNKYDIIVPTNKSPHGLAIYIHGGGFVMGDKRHLYKRTDDIKYFIDNNIAVATINYRYRRSDDSLGVKACIQDVQRAIQYLKFNSAKYNIDKSRVGCYGVSAGAGSSLYHAFHDNLAIKNDKTLLGESTRLKCVGAIDTQSTYNVFAWKKVIPFFRFILFIQKRRFYNSAANFYGYSDYKSLKPDKEEITTNLDMLKLIDSNDPPVYLINMLDKKLPISNNVIQHHRKHAVVISKKLEQFGIEHYLYTHKNIDQVENIDYSIKEFMVKHLQ